MRPTNFDDSVSETLIGSVARIQKLPSSSLGMNSPPRKGESATASTTGKVARPTAAHGRRSAKAKSGW